MSRHLTEADIAAGVEKLARLVREGRPDGDFALVGIRSRGDEVAERILGKLAESGVEVPMGVLDISLYRDDLAHLSANPKLMMCCLPGGRSGRRLTR